ESADHDQRTAGSSTARDIIEIKKLGKPRTIHLDLKNGAVIVCAAIARHSVKVGSIRKEGAERGITGAGVACKIHHVHETGSVILDFENRAAAICPAAFLSHAVEICSIGNQRTEWSPAGTVKIKIK